MRRNTGVRRKRHANGQHVISMLQKPPTDRSARSCRDRQRSDGVVVEPSKVLSACIGRAREDQDLESQASVTTFAGRMSFSFFVCLATSLGGCDGR